MQASSITSGERPGSFDPMLGPWSRGAVCGDRCLPVDLAPTPGSEHLAGRAGNPQTVHKKIAEKCRRPFSDPPGDLIDRWEHRDGRGRAPRANGSDIPFSAIPPDLRGGKGVNPFPPPEIGGYMAENGI